MSIDLLTPVTTGLDAVHAVQDRAGGALDAVRSVDVTKAAHTGRRRAARRAHRVERRLARTVGPALEDATRRARRARRRADRAARHATRRARATVERIGPAPRRRRGRRLLVVLLVVGGGAAIVAVIVRRMRDLDTTAGTPDPFGAAVAATEDEREHLQHAPTATRH